LAARSSRRPGGRDGTDPSDRWFPFSTRCSHVRTHHERPNACRIRSSGERPDCALVLDWDLNPTAKLARWALGDSAARTGPTRTSTLVGIRARRRASPSPVTTPRAQRALNWNRRTGWHPAAAPRTWCRGFRVLELLHPGDLHLAGAGRRLDVMSVEQDDVTSERRTRWRRRRYHPVTSAQGDLGASCSFTTRPIPSPEGRSS
jgi:hypothetical protein